MRILVKTDMIDNYRDPFRTLCSTAAENSERQKNNVRTCDRREKSPVRISCFCPGPVDTDFNRNSGVAVSGKQIRPSQAAREGVNGALRGKMIVIPGLKMPLVVKASGLIGEHLSTRVNYLLQVKKAGKH